MSETKHTPGKWRTTTPTENGTPIIANVSGDWWDTVARVTPRQGEERANAERIVACMSACEGINPDAVPDLLAACELACGFCVNARENWPDWQDHQEIGMLFNKLTVALSKAKRKDGAG